MSQDLIKTENQTPNASMNESSDWELATLWRRGWRVVKWAAAGLLALAFVTVIGQGFLYYQDDRCSEPMAWFGFRRSVGDADDPAGRQTASCLFQHPSGG